jgi:hypothetical protein
VHILLSLAALTAGFFLTTTTASIVCELMLKTARPAQLYQQTRW